MTKLAHKQLTFVEPEAIKTQCPCCGTSINATLPLVSLDDNMISFHERSIPLTATETEIMFVLREAFPGMVRNQQIINKVWSTEASEQAIPLLRVTISHIRKKLPPDWIKIVSVQGVGYCLKRPIARTDDIDNLLSLRNSSLRRRMHGSSAIELNDIGLTVSIDTGIATFQGKSVHVRPPKALEVFYIMAASYPDGIGMDDFCLALWGSSLNIQVENGMDKRGRVNKGAREQIHCTRKMLTKEFDGKLTIKRFRKEHFGLVLSQ